MNKIKLALKYISWVEGGEKAKKKWKGLEQCTWIIWQRILDSSRSFESSYSLTLCQSPCIKSKHKSRPKTKQITNKPQKHEIKSPMHYKLVILKLGFILCVWKSSYCQYAWHANHQTVLEIFGSGS